MDHQVMVSVFCLAYNHEKYVRNALDGFVGQKTDFKFEVLIHDDASTDNTVDIIREYQEKYPELIHVILQKENQYCKKFDLCREFLLPCARGKYLAFCEGDDYWTDPNKLQKQFDFMEKNPEYSICFHRAVRHFCDGNEADEIFPEQTGSRDYSANDIIRNVRVTDLSFPTAAMFVRGDVYKAIPDCFDMKTSRDIAMQIYAAFCGKYHCLQNVMCVYNALTEGSFTRAFRDNKSLRIEHNRNFITMLKNVDEYYNYKYTEAITYRIRYHEYHIFKHLGEREKIQGKEYEEFRIRDEKRKALKIKQGG